MSLEPLPIGPHEHRAITCICVLAAFADGTQDEGERARIQQVVNGFSEEHIDLASAYQDVLEGKISMAAASNEIQSATGRALAYEMAVCVCNADGVLNDAENKFLAELRQALHLDSSSTATHQQTAQAIAAQPIDTHLPPVGDASQEAELDKLILNAAILNGALEIMPHTLATREELKEEHWIENVRSDELLAVDEGLDILAKEDPEAAQLIKLRYFVGMSMEEAATTRGMPPQKR